MTQDPAQVVIEARHRILTAALPHVAFDGWNEKLLKQSVADAGYAPIMGYRAFPEGVSELVDFFCTWADEAMLEACDRLAWSEIRMTERVVQAVLARLKPVEEHREAVRRTLAFYATRPWLGLPRLYQTVDVIWRKAGDSATDFNFYTKRALLAGVYTRTLLFWLDNHDPKAVESFLRARIAEVMQIGKWKQKIKDVCRA